MRSGRQTQSAKVMPPRSTELTNRFGSTLSRNAAQIEQLILAFGRIDGDRPPRMLRDGRQYRASSNEPVGWSCGFRTGLETDFSDWKGGRHAHHRDARRSYDVAFRTPG